MKTRKKHEVQREQDDVVVRDDSEEAAEVQRQPKLRTVKEEPSLLDLAQMLTDCRHKLIFITDCFAMSNPHIDFEITQKGIYGFALILNGIVNVIKQVDDSLVEINKRD